VSEKSNATKTFSELSSSSASAHKCTAQLLLIIPSEIQEYQLVAEDTIEMRQTELRHFHRFSMGALVLDNVYYLMGPKEIIEVFINRNILFNI
jgi:hypothetical protein